MASTGHDHGQADFSKTLGGMVDPTFVKKNLIKIIFKNFFVDKKFIKYGNSINP